MNVVVRRSGSALQEAPAPIRQTAQISAPIVGVLRTIQWVIKAIVMFVFYGLATVGAIALSIVFFAVACVIAFLGFMSYLLAQPPIHVKHWEYIPLKATDNAEWTRLQMKALDLTWLPAKKIDIKPLPKGVLKAMGRVSSVHPPQDSVPEGVDQEAPSDGNAEPTSVNTRSPSDQEENPTLF